MNIVVVRDSVQADVSVAMPSQYEFDRLKWVRPLSDSDHNTGPPLAGMDICDVAIIGGGPAVEIRFGRPVSYGIRRREFDHYLLERCGARLRLGAPVKKIARAGRRWIIETS